MNEIRISEIHIGSRARKDLGDISELARSIEAEGLLQPIGVTKENKLVFGERRIRAFESLNRERIPALIVNVTSILAGEYAENQIRKNFNVSERVAIGEALERELGERRGKPLIDIPQNLAELKGKETGEIAAEKIGFGNKETYRQAKIIVEEASPELMQEVDSGKVTVNAAYTKIQRNKKEKKREASRKSNRAKIQSAPTPEEAIKVARFSTIAIDPPWDWGDEGDVDQMGRARPTYGTMGIDEIEKLPVANLADEDCHLYLWITNRSLPKGFRLLEAWGFRYVTCLTWCKPSFGMGNYFRGSTEQILFAVRGSMPLKRKDAGTWFQAKRGPDGHSSKPDEFFELVESCSSGPYLEMFSRRPRAGWIAWGADAR